MRKGGGNSNRRGLEEDEEERVRSDSFADDGAVKKARIGDIADEQKHRDDDDGEEEEEEDDEDYVGDDELHPLVSASVVDGQPWQQRDFSGEEAPASLKSSNVGEMYQAEIPPRRQPQG